MNRQTKIALIVKAGLTYFGLVFGIGAILGPVRVLVVVPQVGDRIAELIEAPLMLAVMIVAVRWVVRRFAVPPVTSLRFGIGAFALSLGLLFEFTVVLAWRGLTIPEYFATRDPIAATVYYLLLLLFALLPVVIGEPFQMGKAETGHQHRA